MPHQWPKRADGSNKTVSEMSPQERRAAFQDAAHRVKRELESPAMKRALRDYLNGDLQ